MLIVNIVSVWHLFWQPTDRLCSNFCAATKHAENGMSM